MTPRKSVRAAARRLYEEMSGEGAPRANAGTPTPDPSPQGGGDRPSLRFGGQDLMAQVRALYEDTAVPVREIALRAGVTERTLYKYARKNGWTPRYAWTPDGSRPPGRPARLRWSEAKDKSQERALQVAPEKGAGGRFIRREDKGKPFAHGIKALDPAARAAAVKASAGAESAARRAQAEADAEAQLKRFLRVTDNVSFAFAEYNRFQRDRAKRGVGEYDDELLYLHARLIETAMRRWEWFVEHEDLGVNAVERPCQGAPVTPPAAAAS